MPDITLTVALDASRRRDLKLVAGDELTLSVVVYEHDADQTPLVVTGLTLNSPWYPAMTLPIGTLFTVPDTYGGRRRYAITGDIGGNRTTLCWGIVEIFGYTGSYPSGTDYGWWPYGWLPWL